MSFTDILFTPSQSRKNGVTLSDFATMKSIKQGKVLFVQV